MASMIPYRSPLELKTIPKRVRKAPTRLADIGLSAEQHIPKSRLEPNGHANEDCLIIEARASIDSILLRPMGFIRQTYIKLFAWLLQMAPSKLPIPPSELAIEDLGSWGNSQVPVGAEGEPTSECHPQGFYRTRKKGKGDVFGGA